MSISNTSPSSSFDLLSNSKDDYDSETYGSISIICESSQKSIRTIREDNVEVDVDEDEIERLF